MRGLTAAVLMLLACSVSVAGTTPLEPFPGREAASGQYRGGPVVGTIVKIDAFEKTVTVRDYRGRAVEAYLGNGARVFAARDQCEEFRTVYDLKPGLLVQVDFSGGTDSLRAEKITILPGQENRIYLNYY
ncbi:MAG: hypothetical protein ACYC5N_06295 [Endomicrobiales bacterium]